MVAVGVAGSVIFGIGWLGILTVNRERASRTDKLVAAPASTARVLFIVSAVWTVGWLFAWAISAAF
jgi:hypothetical protein